MLLFVSEESSHYTQNFFGRISHDAMSRIGRSNDERGDLLLSEIQPEVDSDKGSIYARSWRTSKRLLSIKTIAKLNYRSVVSDLSYINVCKETTQIYFFMLIWKMEILRTEMKKCIKILTWILHSKLYSRESILSKRIYIFKSKNFKSSFVSRLLYYKQM